LLAIASVKVAVIFKIFGVNSTDFQGAPVAGKPFRRIKNLRTEGEFDSEKELIFGFPVPWLPFSVY